MNERAKILRDPASHQQNDGGWRYSDEVWDAQFLPAHREYYQPWMGISFVLLVWGIALVNTLCKPRSK